MFTAVNLSYQEHLMSGATMINILLSYTVARNFIIISTKVTEQLNGELLLLASIFYMSLLTLFYMFSE